MIEITQPDWNAPKRVHAFTTTAIGGVSKGHYAGLNLGTHVGDNPENVTENRARLQRYVGDDVRLCWLRQTHSDTVVDLANDCGVVEADAAVSARANTACIVMTADCLPVLLCNETGTKVAALHCGWRGLYQDVIGKTLRQYFADTTANGSVAEGVMAWLGPAIGQSSYEVDDGLYRRFTDVNADYATAFIASRVGHYLFDLTNIARQQLVMSGLSPAAIFGGHFDTFSDRRYFSYRQNPHTGRMASVIYRRD